MSVDWEYYNNKKFTDIENKYLPSVGEGETMASQIVTAVSKLVYKWYNDGDVYDNRNMTGWCNDLSTYANWLYKYVPETKSILKRVFSIDYDNSGAYENILKALTDLTNDEGFLTKYNKSKIDSIYDADGPFIWEESSDDEDDEGFSESEDYYGDDEDEDW